MGTTNEKPQVQRAFWRGFRDGIPFALVVGPFGLVFGVLGAEAGLSLAQAMGFSVGVLAGASQFAALQLMTEGAPLVIVVLAGLLVNLRMAMYSASLAPWLGAVPLTRRALLSYLLLDQPYAVSIVEFERRPALSLGERTAYFLGSTIFVVFPWLLATWAGVRLGATVPQEWPLDFALPIAFLSLIAPMLRSPAHLGAALVSIGLALALWWLPYTLGLLVAAIAAMLTGARIEVWLTRRRKALAGGDR
jgi:predicted branched-subunit amino acid permease